MNLFVHLKKNHLIYFLFFILFLSILFRIKNFHYFGLWQDELHTFYNSYPFLDFHGTIERLNGQNNLYHREDNSFLYFFILKYYLKIVGYDPYLAKSLNIFIGSIIPIQAFYICRKYSSDKHAIVISFFIATNILLIHQSQNLRPPIFSIFLVLLSIQYFLDNFAENFSLKNSVIFTLTNTLMLSSHIFTSFILVGYFLIFIFEKKNKKQVLILIALTFLSILLFIIFNFGYILDRINIINAENSKSYAQIEKTFFINFFFRTFFGTIFFGAINLILIFYLILKINFNIWKHFFLKFLSIQIFCTYSCLLIFSLIINPSMAPRYILYVLPLIIIWEFIALGLIKIKIFLYLILFILNICNTFFLINSPYIEKPKTNKILDKIIKTNITSSIYFNIGVLNDNYILSHKQFKNKKLIFIDFYSLKQKNHFWYLCENQPRSRIRRFNPNIDNCSLKIDNYGIKHVIKLNPDYIAKLYEKKKL